MSSARTSEDNAGSKKPMDEHNYETMTLQEIPPHYTQPFLDTGLCPAECCKNTRTYSEDEFILHYKIKHFPYCYNYKCPVQRCAFGSRMRADLKDHLQKKHRKKAGSAAETANKVAGSRMKNDSYEKTTVAKQKPSVKDVGAISMETSDENDDTPDVGKKSSGEPSKKRGGEKKPNEEGKIAQNDVNGVDDNAGKKTAAAKTPGKKGIKRGMSEPAANTSMQPPKVAKQDGGKSNKSGPRSDDKKVPGNDTVPEGAKKKDPEEEEDVKVATKQPESTNSEKAPQPEANLEKKPKPQVNLEKKPQSQANLEKKSQPQPQPQPQPQFVNSANPVPWSPIHAAVGLEETSVSAIQPDFGTAIYNPVSSPLSGGLLPKEELKEMLFAVEGETYGKKLVDYMVKLHDRIFILTNENIRLKSQLGEESKDSTLQDLQDKIGNVKDDVPTGTTPLAIDIDASTNHVPINGAPDGEE